ncbi:hypothetical protein [Pseudonocardia sp. GCM10023141]|uniref:hypothetical protein n=1 Tax=Pseudonocardia sp. GCM10023141 TaxID=3252653 RepID=UPI00361639A5
MTCTPGRTLTLRGKARPLGEVNIGFELTSTSAGGCTILMTEDVATGPGLAVPRMVRDPLIRMRNIETLQRLRLLAERNDS